MRRPGLDVVVDGNRFVLVKWKFNTDGYAGHVYFKVPNGIYLPGTNNGAYLWVDHAPHDLTVPNAHMALPCLEHGEDFADRAFREIIEEAARAIDLNLTRIAPRRRVRVRPVEPEPQAWQLLDGPECIN